MRILALGIGLALLAESAFAQTQPITPPAVKVIAPPEAKDHVGETVTVEGIVSEVHHAASGKVTFLDMGGRYPNNPFAGVIFSDDANKFPDIDICDGKTGDVTGRVQRYRGAPEIILNDPGQLKCK
jgi:DNA/RNA endonuclease YhcR with UshA esterase domain